MRITPIEITERIAQNVQRIREKNRGKLHAEYLLPDGRFIVTVDDCRERHLVLYADNSYQKELAKHIVTETSGGMGYNLSILADALDLI